MKKYKYEENIEKIENMENYDTLIRTAFEEKNIRILISEIKKIYEDPDDNDSKLNQKISETLNSKLVLQNNKKGTIPEIIYNADNNKIIYNVDNDKIEMSLDCVSGWKPILAYYFYKNIKTNDVNAFKEWIKDYELIRGHIEGHLLWPKHKNNINQVRSNVFGDRIDNTLVDIKLFFKSDLFNGYSKLNLKLKEAYFSDTMRWFVSFESFNDFVDKMNLNCWCLPNEEDDDGAYIIMDLSDENLKLGLSEPKHAKIDWTPHGKYKYIEKNLEEYEKYLENIKEIIKKQNKLD